MKLLTWAFVAMQALDGGLTLWATNNGFIEVNRLYAPVAHQWLAPVLLKVLPAAAVAFVLYRLAQRYPRTKPVTAVGLLAAVAFYLYITGTNIGELIGG